MEISRNFDQDRSTTTAYPYPPLFYPPAPNKTSEPEIAIVESTTNITVQDCYAIGKWNKNIGMDKWCNETCNHSPSFCPPSFCHCEEQN